MIAVQLDRSANFENLPLAVPSMWRTLKAIVDCAGSILKVSFA